MLVGTKHSERSIKKMRESHNGQYHTEITKKKMSKNNARYWLGKKRPDIVERLRVANLGKKHSEEHIKNQKESRSRNGWWKNPEETKIKIGLANSGEKNARWIKDREIVKRNLRNDPGYQQWHKEVKKRDKGKCRINNKDCSGYCEVHHILSWSEYPELRYNINNGITLCQAHHPRKRAEEKLLIPDFQWLVEVSNVLI